MMTHRHLGLAAVALPLALALTGCSSNSGDASVGDAECTTAVLQPLVNDQADALGRGNVMPIDDLQCADGWAVATGTLQPKGIPGTFIFQAQGSDWVWQEPATACGRSPEQSLIPESLWSIGCDSN